MNMKYPAINSCSVDFMAGKKELSYISPRREKAAYVSITNVLRMSLCAPGKPRSLESQM